MMPFLAVILALSTPDSTPPQVADAAASVPETEVSRAARDWLTLVDEGRWNESWAAAGHPFKVLNSVEGWRWASEKVRAPLGAVLSRTLVGEDYTPAPPHGYRVVRFRTAFANQTATETLSLDHEPSGWRVVGISVE